METLIEYCYKYRNDIFVRIELKGGIINLPLIELTGTQLLVYLLKWEKNQIFPIRLKENTNDLG